MSSTTAKPAKLEDLRSEMKKRDVDMLIIPSDDPHLSEYVAACYERRAYASGFTGSAGTAVVTMDRALLWTDSRYWLQASKELSKDWELMKSGEAGVKELEDWLGTEVTNGTRVGIDARVTSATFKTKVHDKLEVKGSELVALEENIVDKVWGKERPGPPKSPVRLHSIEYAGEVATSKIQRLQDALKGNNADALAIAALDDVCWLLNIRGSDILCNPVAFAYAVVTRDDGCILFCDETKLGHEERRYLEDESRVTIEPYDTIFPWLSEYSKNEKKVWLDTDGVSAAMVDAVPEANRVLGKSPIKLMKAIKNDAEIHGMRRAHVRDGAAVVRAFARLQQLTKKKKKTVDEVDVAEILVEERRKDPLFLEPSFPTIAGSGANGAVIHYTAKPGTAASVTTEKMLLVDSGGQYLDGTTDATRTMHFGEPTQREKDIYTRVLKGHIALASAVFPTGTPGFVLEAFARRFLWQDHLDYGHGTGHGVGAALNVHEGPQSISPRFQNMQGLKPGMIVSNEPGFYEPNHFGVPISVPKSFFNFFIFIFSLGLRRSLQSCDHSMARRKIFFLFFFYF